MVGHPGHEVARRYLLQQLERLNLLPFHGNEFELSFERPHPNGRKPQRFTNLVGVIPGIDRSLPPLLLGAHYDSVIDAPSVDDNATSVALNLSIAEEFVERPLQRDLIIAFFDSEEPPFFLGETMGSRRFCEDYCGDLQFACVIVSDLIGHDLRARDLFFPPILDRLFPRLREFVFVMGAESNGAFPVVVEEVSAQCRGIRVVPTLHRYVGPMSDHAAFVDAGQPFLFLSCGQGEHYHSPRDTMEWSNFKKLARITEFVAAFMERLDREPPGPAGAEWCDPVDFEIRMLRKAVGPLGRLACRLLPIDVPKTRADLDHLLGALIDQSMR